MAYLSFFIETMQEWQRSSFFCNGKRLSGMPLLLYNSFILWNCRELEPIIGSTKYVRFLWDIALVSILLEILFTYCIQSFLRDMNYGSSPPLFVRSSRGQPSSGMQQVKHMLVHRSMGSFTTVSTGVLTVVFQHQNIPISVLPFVNARHLFFVTPAVAYAFCLGILSFLSRSAHPYSAVISGTCAGLTWSSNLSSFMIEHYWANGSFFIYMILCMLSLKAAESPFIPCINNKPWDGAGRLPETEKDNFRCSSSSRHDYSLGNNNFDSPGEHDEDLEGNLRLYSTINDEHGHLVPNMEELNGVLHSDGQEVSYNELLLMMTQTVRVNSANSTDAGVRSRRVLRP
ncbi:unnamed protein product [Cylindrotheca closterium]|uniref:Uncharacterized protein n=1 Tax=Cylindrotheca closterium TaxID=2856 RepID=A0AAD2CQF1_9STRA|nr:unnamed protein product [Cylindrotheca closterium]